MVDNLTKDFHLFISDNMFQRLAPCSRGGFETNGNLATYKGLYICPQERESGGKYLQKHNVKKTLSPAGFLLRGAVHPSLSPSSPLL